LPPLPPLPGQVGVQKLQLPPLPGAQAPFPSLPGFAQQKENRYEPGKQLVPGQAPPVPQMTFSGRRYAKSARGPSAKKNWYSTDKDDEGPRGLSWDEARIDFVPVGKTVRGVVEEMRPYGAFVGFVLNTRRSIIVGEDAKVRGFCPIRELGPQNERPSVGDQLAVRIMGVDRERHRITVSVTLAEPQWHRPIEPQVPKTLLAREPSDRWAQALIEKAF